MSSRHSWGEQYWSVDASFRPCFQDADDVDLQGYIDAFRAENDPPPPQNA